MTTSAQVLCYAPTSTTFLTMGTTARISTYAPIQARSSHGARIQFPNGGLVALSNCAPCPTPTEVLVDISELYTLSAGVSVAGGSCDWGLWVTPLGSGFVAQPVDASVSNPAVLSLLNAGGFRTEGCTITALPRCSSNSTATSTTAPTLLVSGSFALTGGASLM